VRVGCGDDVDQRAHDAVIRRPVWPRVHAGHGTVHVRLEKGDDADSRDEREIQVAPKGAPFAEHSEAKALG
jgi:hypothetical protein